MCGGSLIGPFVRPFLDLLSQLVCHGSSCIDALFQSRHKLHPHAATELPLQSQLTCRRIWGTDVTKRPHLTGSRAAALVVLVVEGWLDDQKADPAGTRT